jgi:hypothetical protein
VPYKETRDKFRKIFICKKHRCSLSRQVEGDRYWHYTNNSCIRIRECNVVLTFLKIVNILFWYVQVTKLFENLLGRGQLLRD